MDWKSLLARTLKFLASLKLAVIVLVLLATIIAAGTIIEAKYNDATAASKMVYRTPLMFFVMGLLAVNLTAVMVDRWPWRRRHLSFILAHIGILILLLGSLITMKWGLDGSLRIPIGQSSRFVASSETDLTVWSSFDGERFTKLFEKEVDFFVHRPPQESLSIPTDAGDIKVIDYRPYMMASRKVSKSEDPRAGSALQFQIQNARVNVTEWVVQDKEGDTATHNFGPALLHLGKDPGRGSGKNEVFLDPQGDRFRYAIYNKDGALAKKGTLREGEILPTGWMGLELKVLRFLPKASFAWDFKEASKSSELTNAAIRISFQGKEHWLQLDDVLKLFTEKAVYVITYGHRRIDIGFDVRLKEFQIGRYPGTMRAAAYESRVEVPGLGESTISMNEPLKHRGLTLYQASFQDGPDGTPVASVLSVNYDPGRWLKYLGSLIISIGVIVLFYDRRKAARAQLAPKSWEE